MKKLLPIIKYFVGWPLSLIALFFVIKVLIGKSTTLLQIHSLNNFLLILSIISFIAFFFVRALFWQKLLNFKSMHYSYKETAFTWGLSEFKRYVPGSIWSILSRSSAYEKQGSERKEILASILQEAEFLTLSCIILSLFSINFLLFGLLHLPYMQIIPIAITVFTAMLVVFYIFHKKLLPHKTSFLHHIFPDFSISQMIHLLFIMIFAFFLFGLATFFAINSLVSLYLPHVIPLVGFFVFTFLAGYLSFFAPMGLGVREGLITVGLARYVSVADAALGSLFSRVIQIVSELLFLLLCIIWEKVKSQKVKRIEAFLLKYKYEIAVFFSSACYIIYFTLASFLRYTNFFTGRFDLGNMDQTVWNTIHGRIFQLTDPNGTAIVSRLSFHADFMLILLSSLYVIWQDPRMLLFIQTLAIGTGGLFIYLISKDIIKKKSIAFAFTISYLLFPALEYANLFDFHAVTIAVPLFLAAWYFIHKGKLFPATVLLLFAATVKEQVWIIVGFFGLFFLLWKKKIIFGLLLTIISFALFYILIKYAIPSAHGGSHFALSYYSDFGNSPESIIKTALFSPLKTLSIVFGKRQLTYLLGLFGPVGFLPLFGLPVLLLVSPDLGISLLSQNAQLHEIYYHYGAIPTPFFFIAAIYGLAILLKWNKKVFSAIAVYLVLIPAVFCAYLLGPLPGSLHPDIAMFTNQLSYAPLIDNFLVSIPKRYSVAATNNVGSHLSHRQKIFTIPVGLKEADIVVFLLNDSYAQPSLADQKKMALQLDNDSSYIKLFQYQDFVVYKKKSVPTYYRVKQKRLLPLFKGN